MASSDAVAKFCFANDINVRKEKRKKDGKMDDACVCVKNNWIAPLFVVHSFVYMLSRSTILLGSCYWIQCFLLFRPSCIERFFSGRVSIRVAVRF